MSVCHDNLRYLPLYFHRAVKSGSQAPLLVTIAGDSFANAWSVSALGALHALYVVSIDMVDI